MLKNNYRNVKWYFIGHLNGIERLARPWKGKVSLRAPLEYFDIFLTSD